VCTLTPMGTGSNEDRIGVLEEKVKQLEADIAQFKKERAEMERTLREQIKAWESKRDEYRR
jgi:uncharacterized coiled-coil DUF342 family protein